MVATRWPLFIRAAHGQKQFLEVPLFEKNMGDFNPSYFSMRRGINDTKLQGL